MPRNPGSAGDTLGQLTREGGLTESATENIPPRFAGVRVKRWGKSPPRPAQARRHGKPHRVQGQIEGTGRSAPESETVQAPGKVAIDK